MSTQRLVALGLCSGTHDSAAALITDGELVGLCEEERLNGVKHTRGYPARSIDWLLQRAGMTSAEVTTVAYNFAPARYLAALPATLPYLARPETMRRALPRAWSFAVVYSRARQRLRDLRRRFPAARVRGVGHHRAHGLYAFAASGYPAAAVLVADSLGEVITTTIARARVSCHGVDYDVIRAVCDPASLGYAYGAVTEHLGWRRGDEEGTVMALAALGDPARFRELLAQAVRIVGDAFTLDPRLFPLRIVSSRYPRVSEAFITATCPARSPEDDVQQVHADLAAAVQERIEHVMVHLARRARELTGARLLCIGGGVAMNCVAIGRIVAEAGFDEVFVPPAPSDSGTAAGAALAAHLDITGKLATRVENRCYLGPSFEHLQLAERPRPNLTAIQIAHPARFLAAQLAKGAIAGVFQGAWRRDHAPWVTDRSSPLRCAATSCGGSTSR